MMINQKTRLDVFIVSSRWKRINQLEGDVRSVGMTKATIGRAKGGSRIAEAKKKWPIGERTISRSERVMPNVDVRRPLRVAAAIIADIVMAKGRARSLVIIRFATNADPTLRMRRPVKVCNRR